MIPQRVGFRRFAIEDGIMKLNGKRIVFKGVDRHEFSSRRGRVPNHDELLRDIAYNEAQQYQCYQNQPLSE